MKRLDEENRNIAVQIDFWRRRAFELEQQLNLAQTEAGRWRQMARETAEKLWDIAQLTNGTAFASPDPVSGDLDADADVDGSARKLKAVG
jgi:hypothetical protein